MHSRTGHLPRKAVELGAVAGALLRGLQVTAYAAAADSGIPLVRCLLPCAVPIETNIRHTIETSIRQGPLEAGRRLAARRKLSLKASRCAWQIYEMMLLVLSGFAAELLLRCSGNLWPDAKA